MKVITFENILHKTIFDQVLLDELKYGLYNPTNKINCFFDIETKLGKKNSINFKTNRVSYDFLSRKHIAKNRLKIIDVAKQVEPKITKMEIRKVLEEIEEIICQSKEEHKIIYHDIKYMPHLEENNQVCFHKIRFSNTYTV